MSISTALFAGVTPFVGIDPGVVANDTAPWLPLLRTIAGWVLVTVIIALVIVIIIGALMFGVGKMTSTQGAQQTGAGILIWGFGIAAIVGSVSGLVYFFSGLSLAPATASSATQLVMNVVSQSVGA